MLLEESTTQDDLKAYLDHMFKVITPGKRLIASIGDTTPPNSEFERLLYIGECFEKDGRLPLEAGGANYITEERLEKVKARVTPGTDTPVERETAGQDPYAVIREDVLKGDGKKSTSDVHKMLDGGFKPKEILNRGMLSAMEVIGEPKNPMC